LHNTNKNILTNCKYIFVTDNPMLLLPKEYCLCLLLEMQHHIINEMRPINIGGRLSPGLTPLLRFDIRGKKSFTVVKMCLVLRVHELIFKLTSVHNMHNLSYNSHNSSLQHTIAGTAIPCIKK
jgi:hypothetical protein